MSIINIFALVKVMGGKKNSYTYTKVNAMLSGYPVPSTKPDDVRQVKKAIEKEFILVIDQLTKLEKEFT